MMKLNIRAILREVPEEDHASGILHHFQQIQSRNKLRTIDKEHKFALYGLNISSLFASKELINSQVTISFCSLKSDLE